MAEIPFEPYTGQGKLRFWCQKVLPLVYDDSLSYYELLGKVVEYLNNTIEDVSACEDNITALRDAFVQLQDYVNEVLDGFDAEVERVIDEMIDSGEFDEILSGVVNGLIASEYDETTPYVQFAYCLKNDKLYCATASTTGTWDQTKWRETTVGNDMQLLSRRLYNLNAGQVSYNSSETYNNSTVGKELSELKGSLNTETTARRTTDNNIQGLITAYIETGTTASRAYGKGQIIEVDGVLYSVIQPIASGAAFTIGTNIERTTVGNEFSKFVLVESTLTFNDGAAFFYDGHIKANSKLLAGISYLTPGTTSGEVRLYFVTVQPNIDGRAVIYIRNADGTVPPTVELTVFLIISNQV